MAPASFASWLTSLRSVSWTGGGVTVMEPDQYPYTVDIHVQISALQEDGAWIDGKRLAGIMRERGLVGLVVTDHDQLPPREEIEVLSRRLGDLRLYRAAEISTSEGHCLVIGIDDLDGFEPGLSTWDAVKLAEARDAAVILAHPSQPTPLTPQPMSVADMAPGIHGIEVMSSSTGSTDELEARIFAHERGWTMVAGSDALSVERIGSAVSAFPRLPADERDLAAMVRVGALRPERPR